MLCTSSCRHAPCREFGCVSLKVLSWCVITTVLLFRSADNCFCQGDEVAPPQQPGPPSPPPLQLTLGGPRNTASEMITTRESKHVQHPGAGSARRLKAAAAADSSIIHAARSHSHKRRPQRRRLIEPRQLSRLMPG